ncbi:MAG: hypothetical protein KDA21_12760 [Phycisphaerales bacterium]|nr:hypothetical protein [Phycisphaerales bacterium]
MLKSGKRVGLVVVLGGLTALAGADTNVAEGRKFAWGENVGWLNFRDAAAGSQGVRVYPDHLSGFVWGENIGWINVGPGNGPYENDPGDSATFGVNVDPSTGDLYGLAWGENIGWVNFDTTTVIGIDGAHFDLSSGHFSGFAWGENIGWINLGGSTTYVCAQVADVDGDGSVTFADLNELLDNWASSVPAGNAGDVNGDAQVNFQDLEILLDSWASTCS